MVYLSKEEFEFLKKKRVEFLKRWGQFGEEGQKVELGGKNELIGVATNKDLNRGRGRPTPCYQASNIHATRDSSFWSWRGVKEYYQDLSELGSCEEEKLDVKIKRMKKLIRS